MKTLLKIAIAIALPLLAYYTGVKLPVSPSSWQKLMNNFAWVTMAVYYLFYLPVRGIGNRPWVFKVLMVLLGIAIVASTWQAANDARTQGVAPQAQAR